MPAEQRINIEDWLTTGESLWGDIQSRRLVVIWWNNPWARLALVAMIPAVLAVATWAVWKSLVVAALLALLSIPPVYMAVKFYLIGLRTGGLYSFFASEGFGIGCDADRILIPYNEVRLPEVANPSTVNENYILLPVVKNPQGIKIESKDGSTIPWDKTPYKRGIIAVEEKSGEIVVSSYPNEMIVHLWLAVYPLALYLHKSPTRLNI